jgi:hypothetical protein
MAVSLGRVLDEANRRAMESGIDVAQSLITITPGTTDDTYWRVHYGPRAMNQRGGDFIVAVDARDGSIKRVLRGQ